MLHLVNDASGELVKVPEGENSIGRGALLKVTDKRVSRNHALLLQQGGKLKLCPKHRNPCFYKEAGKDSFVILPKDSWKELHHGDRFSLLPEDLVFRVEDSKREERNKDSTVSADDSTNTISDPIDELFEPMDTEAAKPATAGTNKSTDTKTSEPSTEQTSSSVDRRPPKLEPRKTETVSDTVPISTTETTISKSHSGIKTLESASSMSSVSSTKKPRTLPAWLSGISSDNKPPPPKKRKAPAKKPSVDEDEDTHPPPPKKAAKATSSTAEKKAKEDSAPTKPKPKMDPKPAGPKKAAAAADTTGDGKEEDTAKVEGDDAAGNRKAGGAKKKTAGEKKLPLCPYGKKCYRKNPAHFREYSHDFSMAEAIDSSGDEVDSDIPECPYGTDCYRKKPAHLREYKHTAPPASPSKTTGSRRSARKTKGKRVSALAGDSDDDDLPNTYDYTDSFLDDDDVSKDSSTSYGGNSEDSDWAPPAADGEDVSELVADAKAFISNKKMRKPA